MRPSIQFRRSALIAFLWCISFLCSCAQAPVPTPTAIPSIAPTAAASPLPTATTVPPAMLFERGLQQRGRGEYAEAAASFYEFLTAYPDHPRSVDAQFYLAESFALRRAWSSATAALELFVQRTPDTHAFYGAALIWLARSYAAQDDHAGAAETYDLYVQLNTAIAPYVLIHEAEELALSGEPARAVPLLERAAQAPMTRVERAFAYEQAAAFATQANQPAEAQRFYGEVLALSQVPDYRARIMVQGAVAAEQAGDAEQQHSWLADAIATAPASDAAQQAADQLTQAGAPVDPALLAAVYAAHQRGPEARAQFDSAIIRASGEVQLELRRQRALTLREDDPPDYAAAMSELAAIGAESPYSAPGRQAQLDWIQTRGLSGDVEDAIAAYRAFAAAYPDDPRAPEAMNRSATLLERQGRPLDAAREWVALADRYPDYSAAADGLSNAAMLFYQAGDFEQAQATWQVYAKNGPALQQAEGSFWQGKIALRQGDSGATALLEEARSLAPESYYGARAADLLGIKDAGTLSPHAYRLNTQDWSDLRAWLAAWNSDPLPLAGDTALIERAIALEEVWLHAEADSEWNDLLDQWRDKPQHLLAVAQASHEAQLDHVALLAALRLRSLAPASAAPPEALQRLIYPTPFSDLIIDDAARRDVDPFLVYGLLRQESGFDPRATSWVGARGLAQVMPETGAGLARNFGLADYHEDDLYRPTVSIRFGTAYIGQQLDALDGNVQAALGAYNGGLGNVYRWEKNAPLDDPDVFVELIDYPETRQYIKLVYGFYRTYRRMYQGS